MRFQKFPCANPKQPVTRGSNTVSKALSGQGAVHPDTRERILRAARELGLRSPYVSKRSDADRNLTVGLLASEAFTRRRTSPVLLGVMETFAEHDIAVLLCAVRGDPIRERHFVDSLLRRRVDGILVVGGQGGQFTRRPLRGAVSVPVVYAMAASTGPEDVSVVADDRGGAAMAVRHLVSTGRTLIACILGPRREEASRIKTAAAREVLAEHGLRLAAEPLHGLWTEHWGRQAATQLVHAGIAFDGLMCGNDTIARGAVSALAALGVSVPDDVGVVGFDNWTVMAEADEPQLTSVDLNLQEA